MKTEKGGNHLSAVHYIKKKWLCTSFYHNAMNIHENASSNKTEEHLLFRRDPHKSVHNLKELSGRQEAERVTTLYQTLQS